LQIKLAALHFHTSLLSTLSMIVHCIKLVQLITEIRFSKLLFFWICG